MINTTCGFIEMIYLIFVKMELKRIGGKMNGFGTNMKLVQFCFVVLYNFWAYIQSAADGTDGN